MACKMSLGGCNSSYCGIVHSLSCDYAAYLAAGWALIAHAYAPLHACADLCALHELVHAPVL